MISMNKNKTKIVATLGPVSRDEKIIEELILAGANVFRINTSHNTAEEHKQTIDKIKAVSKRLKADSMPAATPDFTTRLILRRRFISGISSLMSRRSPAPDVMQLT